MGSSCVNHETLSTMKHQQMINQQQNKIDVLRTILLAVHQDDCNEDLIVETMANQESPRKQIGLIGNNLRSIEKFQLLEQFDSEQKSDEAFSDQFEKFNIVSLEGELQDKRQIDKLDSLHQQEYKKQSSKIENLPHKKKKKKASDNSLKIDNPLPNKGILKKSHELNSSHCQSSRSFKKKRVRFSKSYEILRNFGSASLIHRLSSMKRFKPKQMNYCYIKE